MPGRLLMDQQGAIGSTDLKKDRSKAQESRLPPKPDFAQHHHATNGSLSNGEHAPPPTTNGQPIGTAGAVQPPPQLDQSWRESDEYKSMGKLVDRLAHQCFEDLSGQIAIMANQPAVSPENGVVTRPDDPAVSKKRGFMEFAHNQRDRFIKTLVLSDWARHAGDDMAKLVDIKVWQEKQSRAQKNAIMSIGNTKHNVARSKVLNPNIEGALHLLATGKAPSKVPDLGYIPRKRITAKQLLRTLQGMNVTLATRLNIHEDLPPYFNDFSIADGRATFRVPGEFEVDLSLAEEEPSSPFYFIDMRFLFSPAPRSLDDATRGHLEMRTNVELATSGLQGCYNFLHNYVLTHKINVLRAQTEKLIADKWFGCVQHEWKHRVLTIQYWRGQSGKKSWLEFGIGTGKKRNNRSRRPSTPQLTVRWFRKGQLVDDQSLDVNWTNLDTEKILSEVIARHAAWLLSQMKYGLERLAGVNSKLELELATSNTVAAGCSLKLCLPSMQIPLLVRIEPVTGWISISPRTERVAFNERVLNRDERADSPRILAQLLCKTVDDRVGTVAELVGWRALDRRSIKQANFKALFGADIWSWKAYACGEEWGNCWTVLVTYSLSGETWWVAHLDQKAGSPGDLPVSEVTSARRISTGNTLAARSSISRTSMLQIEKLAAAEVSFVTLSQQLASMQIPHRLEKQAPLIFLDSSARIESSPTMAVFFRGAALLKDSLGKDLAVSSIKITHQGLVLQHTEAGKAAEARQEVRLSVETGKLTHLKEFLATRRRDADVAMTESGALALRLRTPFGEPYMEQLLERLRACERLNHYLAVLRHFKFECTVASLHKLAFNYSRSPDLSATFTFARGNGSFPAELRLEPANSNPHHRIRVILQTVFNNRKMSDPFTVLCQTLGHSVGVMQAFEKMESANPKNKAISIHVRHPLLYSVTYKAPLAALTFWVELRQRKQKETTITAWNIKTDQTKQELDAFEAGKAILELSKQKSEAWMGLGDGSITAGPSHGVAEVLEKIDGIMRSSTPTMKQESGAKADDKFATGAQKPQPSQQRPAAQQKAPTSKPGPPQKPNGIPANTGPRMMTVNANASSQNMNSAAAAAARNNQANHFKKEEVIELD